MPGIVKIGRTEAESVEERVKALFTPTAVPHPFVCHFAAEVENCLRVEKALHQIFSEKRVHPKREFFRVEPEKVVIAICIDGRAKDVTPKGELIDKDEQDALDKAKYRRSKIKLDALGIKNDDELIFSRDENIKAIVTDGNKVKYGEEILSLSLAAQKILNYPRSVSGPLYWKFDGELLDERRQRMESKQFDAETEESD
jgi:hypothetical protein